MTWMNGVSIRFHRTVDSCLGVFSTCSKSTRSKRHLLYEWFCFALNTSNRGTPLSRRFVILEAIGLVRELPNELGMMRLVLHRFGDILPDGPSGQSGEVQR